MFYYEGAITVIIKNADIFDGGFCRIKADVEIRDSLIYRIAPCIDGDDAVDFSGCAVLPGFIDIHTHGCVGQDMTDGRADSVSVMSEWLVTRGVTSFCPTSMTVDMPRLRESFKYAADTIGHEKGAYIHGINMEGPFISEAKKGAQSADNILTPSMSVFNELNEICEVKLVDIAPEVEGAIEFIKQAKKYCVVSAAHSDADYQQSVDSINAGITHATHLYNAMPVVTSRQPGLVGAVLDDERVMAELICDGGHVIAPVLRFTLKVLGEDRSIVISDSMMAAGRPDGEYTLGGQKVFVRDGTARLADGTVAGSTTNIFSEFRNLMRFGIPLRQIIKSCTINPARSIGVDKTTGSIEEGKLADLLVMNTDLSEIKAVFVKGERKV